MRFSTSYPTLLASVILLSSFTFALPVPVSHGKISSSLSKTSEAEPKDPLPPAPKEPSPPVSKEPLPGRTGISEDKNGLVTGHWGDDSLPEHMRHVQDNQAEFPENKEPFDINPFGAKDRTQKIGNAPAGPHPVTGEPRVKDEKPLASQKIPGKDNHGTTFQTLSHKESGAAPLTNLDKEDATKGKPPAKKPTDGSYTSELRLTNDMAQKAKAAKANGKKQGGKIRVKPNPGWKEMKTHDNSEDPQLRAHEAPAVMQTAPHTKKPDSEGPSTDPKGKGKMPAEGKGKSSSSTKGKPPAEPVAKPPPDPESRKGRLRPATVSKATKQPEPRPPKDPKKPSSGSSGDVTKHPNYRESRPKVPNQYKPGTPESKSPTPDIHPPAEDPTRLPPRPQNADSGLPKPAPPRTTPSPPRSKDDSANKGPLESAPFKKLPDGEKNDKGEEKPSTELPSRPKKKASEPATPKKPKHKPAAGSSGSSKKPSRKGGK